MTTGDRCCAVIAAAGASSRMNLKINKQFLPLLGMPTVARTICAFEAAARIDCIVLVCRPEDREQMEIVARGCGAEKVVAIVAGGATRQQSVACGAAAVPAGVEWIAVHDGDRPLVRPEEIDACVADAQLNGASVLAVPVKDTVKLADDSGFVASTPRRDRLWAVQTPQVFARGAYAKAAKQAEEDGMDYTDDCQLLEHSGVRVHLCRGSYENIKLTTPDDVIAAEAVLRRREEVL